MSRESVRPMTQGQFKELVSLAVHAIPADLSFETAEYLIHDKRNVQTEISRILTDNDEKKAWTLRLFEGWNGFYASNHLVPGGFLPGDLDIPSPDKGFNSILLVDDRVAMSRVFEALWKKEMTKVTNRFIVNSPTGGVEDNVRPVKYACRISDVLSGERIAGSQGRPVRVTEPMTLLERLLIELKYGNSLSLPVTRCAGSRFRDGLIPVVGKVDGKLWIDADSENEPVCDCLKGEILGDFY